MSSYAIIETGSKQYRVEPKSLIEVELLPIPEGEKEFSLERVLLVHDGKQLHIGTPLVTGAKVLCEFVGHIRGPKVINFKFRRRKASRRKKGHRQEITQLRIKEIQLGK